jgi:hypothetical protein
MGRSIGEATDYPLTACILQNFLQDFLKEFAGFADTKAFITARYRGAPRDQAPRRRSASALTYLD